MNPAVVWKLNDTITTPNFSTERIIVEVRWQINNRLRRTTTCVKNMATSKEWTLSTSGEQFQSNGEKGGK